MRILTAPAEIDNRQALAGLMASLVVVSGISLAARVFLKDNHTVSAQEGIQCIQTVQCEE